MMLEGLPNILVNALDMLCLDQNLTSWHIKSGPKYSKVTISFISSTMAPQEGEVKYRRATPSRMRRDRNRGLERYQQNEQVNIESDNDIDIQTETTTQQKPSDNDIDNNMDMERSTVTQQQCISQANMPSHDQLASTDSSGTVLKSQKQYQGDNIKGVKRAATHDVIDSDTSSGSTKSEKGDVEHSCDTNSGSESEKGGVEHPCDNCDGPICWDTGSVLPDLIIHDKYLI